MLAFPRANLAIAHGIPSLLVTLIPAGELWSLPVKTASYMSMAFVINYSLTAGVFTLLTRSTLLQVIRENVGWATGSATLVLGFSGGIIYLLLQYPGWIGYIMAPGLFGFLIAVRGNVADAQRQAEAREQTLRLAAQALDARDRYTESHSLRVSELAGQLAEALDLSARECEQLRTAGSLHDLGKIGIPDYILNKPGPLSADEWRIMRQHCDIGADMIAQHSALARLAPFVRHHHERWDGSGYPMGLTSHSIPLGARILAVADSFDTMTGSRLYRPAAMSSLEAVDDISNHAGAWYDPDVVDSLRILHGKEPIGEPSGPQTSRQLLLHNRRFAQLLAAITVSNVGDPLTTVGILVVIYTRTSDVRAVAGAFVLQALATIVVSGVLGAVADRGDRRRLIVGLETLRGAILLATPLILLFSTAIWLLYLLVFALAAINAFVQPARQAAVPRLVQPGRVGRANATVTASGMVGAAVGFPLALIIVSVTHSVYWLFVGDALTFFAAAALIYGLGDIGGGVHGVRLTGSVRMSWSIRPARMYFVFAGLGALLLSMSFPTLIALAYKLSGSQNGPGAFAFLEALLAVGVVVGSIVVGRMPRIGTVSTMAVGLLLTGIFAVGVAVSPTVTWAGLLLLVASIGNPIYAVGNQTALIELGDASNQGRIMASRFAIVQTSTIVGSSVGGLAAAALGPQLTYAVIGLGLVLLAVAAFGRARSEERSGEARGPEPLEDKDRRREGPVAVDLPLVPARAGAAAARDGNHEREDGEVRIDVALGDSGSLQSGASQVR